MRDYTKFFTPIGVAKFMVGLLNPKSGDIVLEPHAGNGSLVRAIKEYNSGCIVFAFEINKEWETYLRNAGANVVVIKDFLKVPNLARFTSCVANPPFGNETDLHEHFMHIRFCVRIGGKIVMIVPQDFNADVKYSPKLKYKEHFLENWAKNSDGTTTLIKIIEFENNF